MKKLSGLRPLSRSAGSVVNLLLLDGARAHEVVTVAGGARDRLRAARRKPDRRMRLLDRTGNDCHVGQFIEAAFEGDVLLCPYAPNDLGAFLEPRAALAAGNVEADELRYAVTLPHSEIEAAVRNDVDRGGIFGDAQGVMQR